MISQPSTAPASSPSDGHGVSDPTSIGGYRVVRRGDDRHGGHVRHGVVGDGSERTAVSIVTFDGAVAVERSMQLIEMLSRLPDPAVPRVLDVALDEADGPAVVLEFCGESVASILARSPEITAGEVVTLVAPIFAAILSLHDRGFAHGSVSVGSISVGAAGRPLLTGCERAGELTGSARERELAAGDDVRGLADVLLQLAPCVRAHDDRERVVAAANAVRLGAATPFSTAFRAAAEVRLFEIGEPSPLAFAASEHERPSSRGQPVLGPHEPRRGRSRTSGDRVSAVAGVARAIGGFGQRARGRISRLTDRIPVRRRGPLVLASVIVVATVVALLVLPPAGAEGERTGSGTESPAADEPASGSGVAVVPDTAAPDPPGPPPPTSTGTAVASNGVAPPSEDVASGARAALDRLAGCVLSPSSSCWATVFEPSSPILAEIDAADDPLGALPEALARPVDGIEVRTREDYGDASVVVISPVDGTRAASVLMIRTEAGWRIREAFDA